MKNTWIISIILIIIAFAASLYFYPQLPESMASHWNTKGEVDDHMSKFWGAFMLPLMLLGMLILFIAIPKIDPLKKNIDKFRNHYEGFIVIMLVFMLAVHFNVLLWNIGYHIPPGTIVPLGVGLLFYYIGALMKVAKRNWFIGIRTPWTLSSDKVWDKTHKLGSIMFKASGLIIIIGLFFPDYTMWFVLIPVLTTSITTIVYSYLEFKKLKK